MKGKQGTLADFPYEFVDEVLRKNHRYSEDMADLKSERSELGTGLYSEDGSLDVFVVDGEKFASKHLTASRYNNNHRDILLEVTNSSMKFSMTGVRRQYG